MSTPNHTISQTELIRKHLESGHSLTALQAIHAPFRCINLSGRIADLRKEGLPIESPMIEVRSCGEVKRVSLYRLKTEAK